MEVLIKNNGELKTMLHSLESKSSLLAKTAKEKLHSLSEENKRLSKKVEELENK